MTAVIWASLILGAAVALHLAYLYLLAGAAIRRRPTAPSTDPQHRFAFLIPAHNEEAVVGRTVATLRQMDYPAELYDIYVVADHCGDATAEKARTAGATCFERREGVRGSKAAALAWLLERVREAGLAYDALVILDADTQVDGQFLRYVDAGLAQGHRIVQGRHVIANPQDGPYPALAWVMMTLDNRLQNQGRSNLSGSARLMGDSVCYRAGILEHAGWQGDSLTEDYDLRLRLLLAGVRIHYLPEAVGRGEAPVTWADARRQRARWLVGSRQARRRYAWPLLRAFLRRPSFALLDGFLQSTLLPYSPLVVLTGLLWAANLALLPWTGAGLLIAWSSALLLLALYPFLGLAVERAPGWAYRALLVGPFFILWRTGMDLLIRLGLKKATWVRTPRRDEAGR